MSIDLNTIKVGDRITFRAVTRWSNAKATRVVSRINVKGPNAETVKQWAQRNHRGASREMRIAFAILLFVETASGGAVAGTMGRPGLMRQTPIARSKSLC